MIPARTHLGETGERVREAQAYLVRHSPVSPGRVDAKHGEKTEASWLALEALQGAMAAEVATATADAARERIARLARSYVDCHVARERERYLDLVMGPADRRPDDFARMSGCALVCRGLLRLASLRHELLEHPYVNGAAMRDLETIGTSQGAWVTPRTRAGRLTQRGDIVVLESPSGGHAFTVVQSGAAPGKLVALVSVDGGQKDDKGAQWIAQMHRTWTAHGSSIVDRAYQERPVRGWIDVGALRW